ncbi:SPOR domain-containing protein [uncultured Rhodoblastus sp.]|uniref:SPOR domain-containing protein n=1 Tax=uncultured Rhodoblastus sp. TaxID=543037 RepID=UPI0025EE2333|nr:SPOR domain-containing protein [uncultured Rhodoblastus sp.]
MGESAAKFRPEIDLDEFERRLRAAAPATHPAPQAENRADPMAELARLLGSEGAAKKEDPFEALFRAQAAIQEIRGAPSPSPAPHAPYAPQFDERAEAQARADHLVRASQYPAEHAHYQEAEPEWRPHAQEAAAGWDGQYDEFPAQAPPPAGRRRVVYGMAAILLAGVAAIGATLAMRARSGGQEVVTIQADADPARIKPEQADSAPANAQTLFDRKDNGNVAKVVAKQEQPADLGATVKSARVVGAAAGVPTPPTPPPPAAAGQATQGEAVFPTPKKVKTVSVRADGSVIEGPDARPQLARNSIPSMAAGGLPSVAPPANGAQSNGAQTKPAPVKTPATTKSTERAATSTTEAALKAPTARPQPGKPAQGEHAGETGGFAVQLAGSPNEAEARAAANTLSAKYASALQGRHATFVQAKVGDKTVYRVRVGHLPEETAKSVCSAIKGQGGSCFVARN